MHLGLDLGTSGVKAVLLDAAGAVLAQRAAPLTLSNPHKLWSEQAPEDWWRAAAIAITALRDAHDLGAVRGIGLSGQMHGAVLLDAADRVLRPAILWNDGRAEAECAALEAAEPRSRAITGNLAMPGFTAPKLLWVKRHEPACFACDAPRAAAEGLVAAAHDRRGDLRHVGRLGHAVARCRRGGAGRTTMLAASGLDRVDDAGAGRGKRAGRPLAGGSRGGMGVAAWLSGRWRRRGQCRRGDRHRLHRAAPGLRLAGHVGRGVRGRCRISSRSRARRACVLPRAAGHVAPDVGHSLGRFRAHLDFPRITGASSEATLLAEVAAAGEGDATLVFHPYLAGERTPHNDAGATGGFFGLSHRHTRADLARAVLEGVAFALADGLDALEAKGEPVAKLTAIGGGARSALWLRIIAAAVGRTLLQVEGGEIGPALGAARLARIACGDGTIAEVCTAPRMIAEHAPDAALAERLAPKRALFRALYPALRALR